MGYHEGRACWKFCLTKSSRKAVVTLWSLLCTKYKTLSKMLGDRLREVIGQAKQIHQSCHRPGRSVMNNLSRMTDVLDVWFPGITAVTEACHDPEVAEGQRRIMKDEQELFHLSAALLYNLAPFWVFILVALRGCSFELKDNYSMLTCSQWIC